VPGEDLADIQQGTLLPASGSLFEFSGHDQPPRNHCSGPRRDRRRLGPARIHTKIRASERPAGKPRPPLRSASSTADHVSSGASGIGPAFTAGQRPVRRRCASAHRKMSLTFSLGGFLRLRTPRCCVSNVAREDPPGRPRPPVWSAASTALHVSPEASGIGPDFCPGQCPVRRQYPSAQRTMSLTLSLRRSLTLRTLRYCASNCAREDPPGKLRVPNQSADAIALQVSPATPCTAPAVLLGQRPVRRLCASAHCKIRR
jgi:hypothetical protein